MLYKKKSYELTQIQYFNKINFLYLHNRISQPRKSSAIIIFFFALQHSAILHFFNTLPEQCQWIRSLKALYRKPKVA